jgi:hypothetical protein
LLEISSIICFDLYIMFLFFFSSALDEESGEIPVAFVVRKNGSRLSPEAVMDYVSERVFSVTLCIYL